MWSVYIYLLDLYLYYIQIEPIVVVLREYASGELAHVAVLKTTFGYDLACTPWIEVFAYILPYMYSLSIPPYDYLVKKQNFLHFSA